MSGITPELDRMMQEIGNPQSDAYRNLRSTIESSPALMQQINTAIEQRGLEHFAVMLDGQHAGADYDAGKKTINLKELDLLNPLKQDNLTYILGHEVQHALNHDRTQHGYEQFDRNIMKILQSGQPIHDYDSARDEILSINRNDEASAHIAGWNALISRIKQASPQATLDDVGKLADSNLKEDNSVNYIKDIIDLKEVLKPHITTENGITITVMVPSTAQATSKDGFTLNPDLSITPNEDNLKAAARHFFDKLPEDVQLGYNGNSDYNNYYGAGHISTICRAEMAHPELAGKIMLDMQKEKLSEELLEQNGISLGKPGARCAYYDINSPNTVRYLDDTANSHRYAPITDRFEPLMPPPAQAALYDPREPSHADHALYAILKENIPQASEARLMQFTAACHVHGITDKTLGEIYPLPKIDQLWFHSTYMGGPMFAKVDMHAPIPTQQQMHEQVQTYDQQQQMIEQARFQERQMSQQQQGPVLGAPMR
jgi:hypothetical protein